MPQTKLLTCRDLPCDKRYQMWFLRAGYDCHPSWWSNDLQVNVSELKRQNSGVCWVFFPTPDPRDLRNIKVLCQKRPPWLSASKGHNSLSSRLVPQNMGKIQGFYPSFGRSILGIARAYWFWMALAFCKFGRPPKSQRLNMNATSRLKMMEVSCVWDLPHKCDQKDVTMDQLKQWISYPNQISQPHCQSRFRSSTGQNSEASQPKKTTGSAAFAEVDLGKPWRTTRHGLLSTIFCPMPPATGWNARPHPPHRVLLWDEKCLMSIWGS